jgi:hypothetical protein
MKARALVFVFLFALGLVLFWYRENEKPEAEIANGEVAAPASTSTPEPFRGTPSPADLVAAPDRTTGQPPTETTANSQPNSNVPSRSIRDEAPTMAQLNGEITANPHDTPPTLLKFTERVASRVDAVRTEPQANALFGELESCVLNPREAQAHSVLAVCLMTARDLSKRYSRLRGDYQSLEGKADPKVVRMVRSVP